MDELVCEGRSVLYHKKMSLMIRGNTREKSHAATTPHKETSDA
jgi:hypothetical protein